MGALFVMKYSPQYVYITEDQAQKEYKEYLRECGRLASEGYTSTMVWLNFEQWLASMEYIIY